MNASNIPALQELEAPSLSKLLDGAYSSDVNIGGTVTSFTQANENIHNTIYNSIGFSISTLSLIIIDYVFHSSGFFREENTFLLLGLGALTGLPFMIRLIKSNKKEYPVKDTL